jgi:outer membrane receptor protein involved in Fe transport
MTGLLLPLSVATSGAEMEEVIVNAEFRERDILTLGNSISIIDSAAVAARSATHIEQLLNTVPNVNTASGASRGRFFQIRGIGERSQFVDPVNPSVGLVIDGIDFTGLGLAANTLDIAQVEILRGPQGTLFGANGLAGMINMTSQAPAENLTLEVGADVAEYGTQTLSALVSGPLSPKARYRLSAQSHTSDGYIQNDFLQRDDTNNIDEVNVRGRLQIDASEDLVLDIFGFFTDVDNGYDAFSLTNTRTTLSDQPGWDRQESIAGSVKAVWSGARGYSVSSILSFADSDTEYGYDEDWTFDGFHPDGYMSTDNYQRERETLSLDLRALSAPGHALFDGRSDWVLGLYARSEEQRLERRASFSSNFDTENVALYGQLDTRLAPRLSLATGLRLEQREADYQDNLAVNSGDDDSFWGGRAVLEFQVTQDTLLYASVSRGYKAGGINGQAISASESNSDITPDRFFFDSEYLWNYELGAKGNWLDERLQFQLALFYQDREDVQAKQSIFNPVDFSFDDFLTNAAAGKTFGLEAEFSYSATEQLRVFGSLGLMEAEFEGFSSSAHVDARDDFTGASFAPVDLDGRDLAHAPNYQYLLGAELNVTPSWFVRLELEARDAFYFSNSHDERSSAYELVNARVGYRAAEWEVALWGRNLTDEDYYGRGFYFSNQFGNNPANGYAPEPYYQLGEPQVVGVSGKYSF